MSRNIYIAAIGMLTPLGLSFEMTAASVQAGLSLYADSTYLNDQGMPLKMALVPQEALAPIHSHIRFYGQYQAWHKLLLQLAHPALQQAMQHYQGPPIPLVLNLPELPELCGVEFPKDFIQLLQQQTDIPLNEKKSRILHSGRAGCIEALALAEKMLFEQGFDDVLLGGIDSYQLPERLRNLVNEQRIAGENQGDGFTPGEAAVFLRLSRNQHLSQFGAAHLCHPSIGAEAGHIYSDAPYLGDGLATAVCDACIHDHMLPAHDIYVTANGERYWAKEIGTALIRNQDLLASETELFHPAEFFGDLGAAAAGVLIALAAESYWRGASQLICASSDYGLRGAVVFGEHVDADHAVEDTKPTIIPTQH